MRKHTRLLFAAGLLAACAALPASADDEDEAVRAAVLKHADQVGKKRWAELVKDGEPIAKKYDLLDLMRVLKKRSLEYGCPGLGVGPRPGAIKPDGIEAMINHLAVRVRPADLENAKNLIRMAEVTAALASMTFHYPDHRGRKRVVWEKLSKDMHDTSLDFIAAVRGKDIATVKKAARKLQATCTACH
jgi:cytochrome c556